MGHFGQDCRQPDYRLLKEKSIGNAKQDREDSPKPTRQYNSQQQREPQPSKGKRRGRQRGRRLRPRAFRPGRALMTAESTMSRAKSTWDLDSCALRHLTNDQSLFVGDIRPKVWDFTIAGGQVIRSEGVYSSCRRIKH